MVKSVTLNGVEIYTQALQEIEKLETEIRSTFELNPSNDDRIMSWPINHHFQGGNGIGNTNEKTLYEDLIIEGT